DPLVSGDLRTLTINNVTDLSGNAIANGTAQFEYIETAEAAVGDVIVNEFLASPDVASTIPDAEFIELLNISDKFIDLANWTFSDNSSASGTFPSFILRPNEYVILTGTGNGSLFDSFGDAIEIPSFRSLNDNADEITLTSALAVDIYQVSYTSSTDGISTELINPNGPDYSENNYGLSTDPDGGTPGAQNSIFDDTPDTTPPTILSVTVISNTALDVAFDEVLAEASAETSTNYSIDGGISVISAMRDASNNQLVHLTVDPLVSADLRTLTINNVTDLSGNAIANGTAQFEYIETAEAEVGDVIINEFLSNPIDDNDDFIELFNNSDKFIDMAAWKVSDKSATSEDLPSFILRPGEYLIIYDEDAATDYSGFGNALTIASLTLNNSNDQIEIVSGTDIQIDFLAYEDSQEDGVSLELVNPNDPCRSLKNYIPSVDPSGSTPGQQNSVFDDVIDTTPPGVMTIKAISSTELDLSFSEALNKLAAETVGNYSIDGGISIISAALDDSNDQLVHLVVDPLTSEDVRTLTINGVEDLCGNPVAGATVQFEYLEIEEAAPGDVLINEFLANPVNNNDDFIELYNNSTKFIDMGGWKISDESSTSEGLSSFIFKPGEYLIIYDEDATVDYSTFGNALTIASLTLNNSDDQIGIVDGSDLQIDFLIYEESQEDGVSLELINPDDPCLSLDSYAPSIDAFGSTPGRQNSVFDTTPDTELPTVLSYNFDTNLTIIFSEVMEAVSLLTGNYSMSGGITVNQASVTDEFPTAVEISFNEPIEGGVLYDLTISGPQDCAGNPMEETTISFGVGRFPTFNELIITEIMFDPDPQIELPNQEFVEVYNATSEILSIEGMSFTDASATIGLPARMLNPGAYYVLATTSAAAEFSSNAIGVSSFPSLNNGGEQLILSRGDELIFSLMYDPDWHDEDKRSGGYSLEMRDISNPCLEDANNWGSSQNNLGGTPGTVNSVTQTIPDNFGPEIVSVTAVTADSIRISFSEKIDPSSVNSVSASLSPAIDVDQVFFNINYPANVTMTLGTSLQESVPYALSIDNVTDCSGNEIQQGTADFALPVLATNEDIKLSEVLFNPRSNGVDFVEIYNDSEKYISLKNWGLGNLDDEGEIDDVDVITTNELVIAPGQFMAFTIGANALLTNYPKGQSSNFFEMGALPSYPNDEGTVLLIDQDETIVESFSYNEDFHYNLLESVDGVSLERVSFEESVNNGDNWRSASSEEGFATPGYANSQSFVNDRAVGTVTASPEVFIPGNVGSGRDFTTINYQFDQPGQFANVNIYDQTGRLVKNLAQGVLLSTAGFLRWDGDTNDGKTARMGYHLIIFEIYDSSGNSEIIKETVVVGRDF
ncbi:MAG: lamin tail domain-containing protein, partial [Ekhidna sp.]